MTTTPDVVQSNGAIQVVSNVLLPTWIRVPRAASAAAFANIRSPVRAGQLRQAARCETVVTGCHPGIARPRSPSLSLVVPSLG